MKLKYIALSLCCLSFFTLFGQPFSIGHTTIDLIDASRNNRVIPTEVYYPSASTGTNVPLISNGQTFPVLVFGHGFLMTWDAYQNIWNAAVPQGYIIAFPKTEGSISPSHLEFARDLNAVLQQMILLGTTPTSLFYNRIGTAKALMGHSMGGGAAVLAAASNSGATVLVNFAAAETNPSAIQTAATVAMPALLFAGSNDCVTPPETNQILMYNQLISACKTIIQITGGSHCQMANSNFFCSVGESSCTPAPTISRSQQQALLNTFLIPWLDYQLKDNCSQGAVFDNTMATQSGITYQKNCIQCDPLQTVQQTAFDIKVYPNPSDGLVCVKGKETEKYLFVLYDLQSKKLLEKELTGFECLPLEGLSEGLYFYKLYQNKALIKQEKLWIR